MGLHLGTKITPDTRKGMHPVRGDILIVKLGATTGTTSIVRDRPMCSIFGFTLAAMKTAA